MGVPGMPHKGYIQFFRESTWKTAPTITKRLPYISCVTTPDIRPLKSNTLNNVLSRTAQYAGPNVFRTTLVLEGWYEGLLLWLDMLMGTDTYGANGATTTGANPYVHTYIEREFLNSMTVEIIEGNIPANQCQRLRGAKVVSGRLRWEAGFGDGAIGTLTLELLSPIYETGQAVTGSLTAVSPLPILFHEGSTMDDGTADAAAEIVMRSAEIMIRNPVAERFAIGSAVILEPLRNDFLVVTAAFRKEFQTKLLMDAVNAFTAGSPKLVFGSSASKRITFDIGTARITEYNHPVSGRDLIVQDVTWEAERDGTNLSALKLTVENTQATITT